MRILLAVISCVIAAAGYSAGAHAQANLEINSSCIRMSIETHHSYARAAC